MALVSEPDRGFERVCEGRGLPGGLSLVLSHFCLECWLFLVEQAGLHRAA